MGELSRVLIDLQVRAVGSHYQTDFIIEHDYEGSEPGKLDFLSCLRRHHQVKYVDFLEGFKDTNRWHLATGGPAARRRCQVFHLLEEWLFENVEALAEVTVKELTLATLGVQVDSGQTVPSNGVE